MQPLTKQPSLAVTLSLFGLSCVLWLAFFGQLLAVVPGFERTFEDFRMKLPWATEMTILASRTAVRYWFLLGPCVVSALTLAAWLSYLIRHRSGNRWLSAAWFFLLLGVPLFANATIWGALWLPYKQLHEGLAK